jgi:hypothetical protein
MLPPLKPIAMKERISLGAEGQVSHCTQGTALKSCNHALRGCKTWNLRAPVFVILDFGHCPILPTGACPSRLTKKASAFTQIALGSLGRTKTG